MTGERISGLAADFLAYRAVHLLLIVLVGVACYIGTLDYPLVFDDIDYLSDNPALRDPSIIIDPGLAQAGTLSEKLQATLKTRKIAFASFWVNYSMGGLNPVGYRLFNIAVHIINGLLVYALMRIVQGAVGVADCDSGFCALICALLFVAHPIQTQAVTYISQRFTSLAAMFYLSSVVLYLLACASDRTVRTAVCYGASLVTAVLGMGTKEITFTLPVMIAIVDFAFVSKGSHARRFARLMPFLIAITVIPLSLIDIHGPLASRAKDVITARTDLTRSEYFITQLSVVATYLRLLFAPVGQSLDYAQKVYRSFLDPVIVMSAVFHLAMLGAGLLSLWRGRGGDRRWILAGVGIFWFYVTISVESSVIVLADLLFEHRVYLPSIGIFMTVTACGSMAFSSIHTRRKKYGVILLLALIVATLAGTSIVRNQVWSDPLLIWAEAVQKAPRNFRAQNNLGQAYSQRGMFDKAIEHYMLALTVQPNSAEILSNIGNAYAAKGMRSRAFEYYEASLMVNPGSAEAQNNIGVAYAKLEMYDKAIGHYMEALRLKPFFINVYNNLANAYAAKGMTEKALESFNQAVAINPANPDIHYNMALTYYEVNMIPQALKEARLAYSLKPYDADMRTLAESLEKLAAK